MTQVEIKASIFDLIRELEELQVKANGLVEKKNELLKQLETPKE